MTGYPAITTPFWPGREEIILAKILANQLARAGALYYGIKRSFRQIFNWFPYDVDKLKISEIIQIDDECIEDAKFKQMMNLGGEIKRGS